MPSNSDVLTSSPTKIGGLSPRSVRIRLTVLTVTQCRPSLPSIFVVLNVLRWTFRCKPVVNLVGKGNGARHLCNLGQRGLTDQIVHKIRKIIIRSTLNAPLDQLAVSLTPVETGGILQSTGCLECPSRRLRIFTIHRSDLLTQRLRVMRLTVHQMTRRDETLHVLIAAARTRGRSSIHPTSEVTETPVTSAAVIFVDRHDQPHQETSSDRDAQARPCLPDLTLA